MKPPRGLTAEEIRQWREANRQTTKKRDAVDREVDEGIVLPPKRQSVSTSNHGGMKFVETARARKNLSPLKQLSIREAVRSFRPYGPIEATLDLHGLSKFEAYERVQHFIIAAKRRGQRHVTIITGKGRGGEVGVLRANLPHWLNEPGLRPLISAVAEARAEKGGAGVMHVLVKAA